MLGVAARTALCRDLPLRGEVVVFAVKYAPRIERCLPEVGMRAQGAGFDVLLSEVFRRRRQMDDVRRSRAGIASSWSNRPSPRTGLEGGDVRFLCVRRAEAISSRVPCPLASHASRLANKLSAADVAGALDALVLRQTVKRSRTADVGGGGGPTAEHESARKPASRDTKMGG